MIKQCNYLKITAMLRIAGLRSVGSRLAMLALLMTGCAKRDSAPTNTTTDADQPRPSVALRVLVVNEPELAEAIGRLRGEWNEHSGGELNSSSTTWPDVAAAKSLDADVIVFPSRYLGELCVRDWLRPVRSNVLQSNELNAADFYPLVRQRLIRWGRQAMALPLGVHSDRYGATPAIALLAKFAPLAESIERDSLLFDSETMKPRIAGREFVDVMEAENALQEWDMTRQLKPNFPPSTASLRPMPVIGFADRLVAVTMSSRNAASAFRLSSWLAAADTSSQLTPAGNRMMPVRRSLVNSPFWYDPKYTASERADLAKELESMLVEQKCFIAPRIPGIDDYLAALDQAVEDSLVGDMAPRDALQKAAARWEQITDSYGRENQRDAYLNHLGIEP